MCFGRSRRKGGRAFTTRIFLRKAKKVLKQTVQSLTQMEFQFKILELRITSR